MRRCAQCKRRLARAEAGRWSKRHCEWFCTQVCEVKWIKALAKRASEALAAKEGGVKFSRFKLLVIRFARWAGWLNDLSDGERAQVDKLLRRARAEREE